MFDIMPVLLFEHPSKPPLLVVAPVAPLVKIAPAQKPESMRAADEITVGGFNRSSQRFGE